MRWPFAKLHRELRILSHDEQRWSIARADYEVGPLLVRFNEAARELAARWEPQQGSLEASARPVEVYLEFGDKQNDAQVLGPPGKLWSDADPDLPLSVRIAKFHKRCS